MKKVFFLFPLIFAFGCNSSDEKIILATETVDTSSEALLEISPKQFELGNMELGTFTKESFNQVIKTTGKLDVPPEYKSNVSAYFGGYVKDISLLEGQIIKKGQTLFVLENPEYIQVQQDFLEIKNQLDYLKSDFERQKDLAKDNINAKKTFLKAESDYNVAIVKFESLKKKLLLMNINPEKISPENLRTTITVTSPITGYVTGVNAAKGMYLNPSDIAVTIMNTDHMHVELEIFEKDIKYVQPGQEITFQLQNDLTHYKAEVFLINKAISMEKRTVNVHCHLTNSEDANGFTPGMYVEAQINASSDSLFALPEETVVTIEDKSYILIAVTNTKNDGVTLAKRAVVLGQRKNGFLEILNYSDFSSDESILIKGAFNLIHE